MVDNFLGWIEASPTMTETADVVYSHLIYDVLPRLALPTSIQLDNGLSFYRCNISSGLSAPK